MENLIKMLFAGKTKQEVSDMLINLNRFQLNRKEHIKKYNKLRKLHGEVLDSMETYINNGKYNSEEYFSLIAKDVQRETHNLNFCLTPDDADDLTILHDLMVYKNHNKIPSLTEIYLDKKILKNKDKVKMLHSMKNSHVGLFKIVDVDRNDGYVYYEDVFTHKRFKIIDIAMSSTLKVDKKRTKYIYNRIITVDDISFGTGIHCMMTSESKELKEFIKKHKYNNCSDHSRCLLLYAISKKENKLSVNCNHQYGHRR